MPSLRWRSDTAELYSRCARPQKLAWGLMQLSLAARAIESSSQSPLPRMKGTMRLMGATPTGSLLMSNPVGLRGGSDGPKCNSTGRFYHSRVVCCLVATGHR